MYSNHRASVEHLERLRLLLPNHDVFEVETEEEALVAADDTVAIMGHRFLNQVLCSARNLKWVQASSAGFDHLPKDRVAALGAVLTTAGFAGPVIAQHATMLSFAMNRRLRECIKRQESHVWGDDLYSQLPPRLRTAMVFGLGEIGARVAAMLAAGGIEVWGVSRSPRQVSGVYKHFSDGSWKNEIEQVDLLVLCLPATSETVEILDAPVIHRLKPTALVVNVGRSETLDLTALISQLQAGAIGGVAIDVTPSRMSLGECSDLWDVPGLLITPYLAARYDDRGRDLEEYVESQVFRWVSDKPLHNVVTQ